MTSTSIDAWPTQAQVPAFFGKIQLGHDGRPTDRWEARSLTTVLAPYPFRLAWDPATTVRKITCHRLVAQSLLRCLGGILDAYGSPEAVRAAGLDLYGGCYNYRPMRAGSTLSMHSYGIAVDLDPDRNPLGRKWDECKTMMPSRVVDIFENAGWTWGGRWTGRPDCMHFQAARI
jgi:hypothetical protein